MKTAVTKSNEQFIEEYNELMKGMNNILFFPQWTKKGDMFAKFSLFESHPTIVSPSTNLSKKDKGA